jgi:beta-1,4-mannosyl-glycoprotein beta-1,4-N-acetylglucosaminyltransferase
MNQVSPDKRVIDCFCYFNEQELFKLRLETLWDVVDVFVVIESDFTQSGLFKGRNLTPALLAPYESKVRYIHVQECPGGTTDLWANENYQRNQVIRGLSDLKDQDWLMISDLDEIPNPSAIQQFEPDRYIRGDFEQSLFGYKLNNKLIEPKREQIWRGSKITTGQHFKKFFQYNATSVRSWKSSGPIRSLKRWWFNKFNVQTIRPGGWHFSWVTPESEWVRKFSAQAHQEHLSKGQRPLSELVQVVANGQDLIFPSRKYRRLEITDPTLPKPVQVSPDTYRSVLLD